LKIGPLDAPFEARGTRAIFLRMTDKRLPRPRDPVQLGKLIGDILTGQVEDRAAPPADDPNKDRAAVALGRKGGLKGGRARSELLTPEERKRIAQAAARKRWHKG
jgi:hypothetical protein